MEHAFEFRSEADDGGGAGLVAVEAHHSGFPVDVSGVEFGDIRLRAAQVPTAFVEGAALGVGLPGDDGLMLGQGDGALFLEPHLRPLLLRQHRPRQPVHVEREVLDAAQVHVRRDGAGLQHLQGLHGLGFEDGEIPDEVERRVHHGAVVADAGGAGFHFGHLVHRHLPGALAGLRVGGGEIGAGDLAVERGRAVRFVLGVTGHSAVAGSAVFWPE